MALSRFFPCSRLQGSPAPKKPDEFRLAVPTYDTIDDAVSRTPDIHRFSTDFRRHQAQTDALRLRVRDGLYRDWSERYVHLALDKATQFAEAAAAERVHHHDPRGPSVRVDYEKFYADAVDNLLRTYLDASDARDGHEKGYRLQRVCDVLDKVTRAQSSSRRPSPTIVPSAAHSSRV